MGTEGRTALVTGANGGFGTRLLLAMVASGWRVTAVVRGGEDRLALHPALQKALRAGQLAVLDLDLDAYVRDGVARPLVDGPLDALVNIAGTSLFGSVSDVPLADYRALMRLNVEAPYLLVQAHLPALARAKGVIVQTSSLSAAMPIPYYGVYASTKLALEGWSEALAHEVAPLGVSVFCVQPGAFRTGVQHRMRFEPPASLPALLPSFRVFRAFVQDAGIRMAEDPDRFAERVLHLVERRSGAFRQPLGPGSAVVRWALRIPERLRHPLVRAVLWARIHRAPSLAMGERSGVVPRT
ncbi:MAG: SDR family NAD(P)-dependent oxidoreductase [Alphaproteobacteria bacterium]|nr:SDR family NAD(P)-dependent oxidoreductase [Alphaproteobacteria bacterium]MCB9692597.1 SDR family NAD(P)-dependent oxidoreductase [Alphaproteobacteria bacterium]